MKNAFAITSLILTAGYPAVVTASMLGVIPFAVPSLFQFIGVYTSLGVLAFAFGDYCDRPQSRSICARPVAVQDNTRVTTVRSATIRREARAGVGISLKAA